MRLRLYALLWATVLAPFLSLATFAQVPAQLSDQAQVSLLTTLPGTEVYAAYGHSALRIQDPAADLDLTFNYGTFAFGPMFVPQFAYGALDYYLSVYPFRLALRASTLTNRPILEQVLALDAAQRNSLYQFLLDNAREENKYYRYDFLYDNCATRIRDALVTTLGEAVSFADAPDPGLTFRQLIDPYQVPMPWLDFGIDLVLGATVDQRATPWQTLFLPDYLMGAAETATVTTMVGPQPLVARMDTLYWPPTTLEASPPSPWPTRTAWLLLVFGLAMTARDVYLKNTGRRLFDGLLFGVVGMAGVVFFVMWCCTLHHVTAQNWNLLWAWPAHIVAALTLTRQDYNRTFTYYWLASAVVALGVVLGWSYLPQDLPSAALPLVLLLALRAGWRAWWIGFRTPEQPYPF